MMGFIRNIKWFFRNLWRYKGMLWTFRSWDSGYIELWASEMYSDVADSIETGDRHIGCEKTVQRARTVARLLRDDRDKYYDPIGDKLQDEKWSKSDFVPADEKYGEGMMELKIHEMSPNKERLLEKRRKAMNDLEKQRRDMLFTYLRKYHKKFWD